MNKKISFTYYEAFPCEDTKLDIFSVARKDKAESTMSVIALTTKVLKDHVLQDESYAFKYMDNVICQTLEHLIAHANSTDKQAIPMELMAIHNIAELELLPWRRQRKVENKNLSRSYVKVWSELFNYMLSKMHFIEVEKIFIAAYNELFGKNYAKTLKPLNCKELQSD